MAKKLIPFLLVLVCWQINTIGQNIQLFANDFNVPSTSFTLNTTAFGPVTGANRWTINNQYIGLPAYPNTKSQDSTVAGTIAGAPFSTYLHIRDVNSASGNANFNPNSASDNFVEMTDGFCTKALYDIKFTFFWLCEGNAQAYGQVYYSVNGGAWILASGNLYNSQSKWKYEILQNPAFDNVEDIRFGFRWVNPGTGGTANASFAVDDIIAVGTYDPINNPVNISITSVSPNPVCRGSNMVVFYSISDTMCYGTYGFELSNGQGSFSSPTSLGIINLNSFNTVGAVAVGIPPGTPADTCYRIRMNRISPPPPVVGYASVCFEVIDCPNIITTHQPIITVDPDTVCLGSVIDIPFNSTGVYNSNNVYIAQLSDSSGSFANPYTLGSSPDPKAYPANPPGMVGGLIPPNIPAGCNYFVRIISTSPSAIGSVWGPFCLTQCDIVTNNRQDLHVCINESTGAVDSVDVDINTYNNNASYFLGNQFKVEVRSFMTFGLVNVGGLGATFDTASTTFAITIPPLPTLLGLGIVPGVYYIRILADSSNTPYDFNGSLVRLTIGAPSENPVTLVPGDSVYCTGDIASVSFFPYNQQSQYQWQFGTGTPFIWPYFPLYINLANTAGILQIRVREINFGCYGPWTDRINLDILAPPTTKILGPAKACIGDTVKYQVVFQNHTYFQWDPDGGVIIDTTNNIASIVWQTPGNYLIDVTALNKCGLDIGYKEVDVYPYPDLEASPDTVICRGDPLSLFALVDTASQIIWSDASGTLGNANPFDVIPTQTGEYYVTAINAGNCRVVDTIKIEIFESEYAEDSVDLCEGKEIELDALNPGVTYLWSTGQSTQTITVSQEGEYIVEIFIPGNQCPNEKKYIVVVSDCDFYLDIPNAFSPNGDGVNDLLTVFGHNLKEYEILIFNRWGEEIYHSTNLEELSNELLGWDGTHKGEPQPIGVYAYMVKALTITNEPLVGKGNITLIR